MKFTRLHFKRLFCITLLLLFGDKAIANSSQVMAESTQSESTQLSVDTNKCRLQSYSVTFDVIDGSNKVGKAIRTLSSTDKITTLSSSANVSIIFLSFSQSEKSTLENYQSVGFASNKYTKQRSKPFSKTKTTIYTLSQNSPSEQGNSEGLFDPLSVYDHLRELVCSGLQTDTSLKVQEEKEIETYLFTYKGLQKLHLASGDIDAILLLRTRLTSTRETSVWFDINNHFLPVKIEQEKDGDTQAVLVANTTRVQK